MNLSIANKKNLANNATGVFSLAPNQFFSIHKDKVWMKALKGRVKVENEITTCIKYYFTKKGKFLDQEYRVKSNENLEYLDNNKLLETVDSKCYDVIKLKYKTLLDNFQVLFPFFPDINMKCQNE